MFCNLVKVDKNLIFKINFNVAEGKTFDPRDFNL
jgi:hypothetical protein